MTEASDQSVRLDLRAAIDDCLELDPRLIEVDVVDGIAVLRGRARSAAQRAAATQVALRVLGVREVANRIEVPPVGSLTS